MGLSHFRPSATSRLHLFPGLRTPFPTEFPDLQEFYFAPFLAPPRTAPENGRSWQAPTGEIGLSEIRNVFAEVSIRPERTELLQKSLRGTHFEATAACFELAPGTPPVPGRRPPFSRSVPFQNWKNGSVNRAFLLRKF